MKKISLLFLFATCVALQSCGGGSNDIDASIVNNPQSANGEQNADLPIMEFESDVYDFGTITQGEKVTHDFVFTNKGKSDLVITTAKGSCGCTVPEWPKNPIKPGEKGKISVIFDSEGKSGRQHKKVSIIANTQPSTNLVAISGEISAPKQ